MRTSISVDGEKALDAEGDLAFGFADMIANRWSKVETADVKGSLETPRFGLAKLAAIFGQVAPVDGMVRVTGSVDGSVDKPLGRAQVELENIKYETARLERAVARLELRKKGLFGSLTAKQERGGDLSVRVFTENAGDAPERWVRLRANDFEIGLLAGLGPPSIRRLGGRLSGRLSLTGRGETIEQSGGTLSLRSGSLALDGALRRLTDIEADLKARGNKGIRFNMRAKSGEGSLSLSTDIAMQGITPTSANGRLALSKLPLTLSSGVLELTLNSTIEGSFSAESIDLDLDVKKGLLRLPKGAGRDLHDVGAPTDVVFVDNLRGSRLARPTSVPSPLPPIVIALSIPQTLSLRGENISGIVEADLELTMHKGKTQLLGYAELVRAWIQIFRHRYEIEKALASFDATLELDPRLDIEMTHAFKTAQFTVLIQGNLSDPPKPEFRAEPSIYDDAQLLSFFLGGSPDDVSRSRSNSARAAGAATSLVTSQLTGIVQEILPVVDVLALESTDESATPDQLLAGKWLTEKMLLAYRARLSTKSTERTNVNEVTVEWWFLRRWLLQVFYGDRQVGAIDALWIHRF